MRFTDETYWPLVGNFEGIEVLATAEEEGRSHPMLWTFSPQGGSKGRVFVSILGHYESTFDDPLFRLLILRGLAWAAGEPAGRLQGLAAGN
ncbi:MAG: ThuA domain-containing protein [Planctomycetes bacterium]|nr:ThuA domain-containing protein [Planctomycetota bacterium]